MKTLSDAGPSLELSKVDAFAAHCSSCSVCRCGRYGYTRCAVGLRLAREEVTPRRPGAQQ